MQVSLELGEGLRKLVMEILVRSPRKAKGWNTPPPPYVFLWTLEFLKVAWKSVSLATPDLDKASAIFETIFIYLLFINY